MLNTVKLGDVVSYEKVNGQGSNRPYVGMENISSETMEVVGSPEIPEKTSSTFKFDERHVLFGRLRPYLRKVLVPNFDGQCSTEIFCLLPSDKVDKKFLAHWLLHPKVSTRINETSTGARMPRANMNAILGFDFPLPPLAEQQRIVAKLDAAFAEIDTSLTNTEKTIQAAEDGLANLIDAKTKNRTGWSEYKVSDLGAVQTGNTPKTSNKENYGTDMPFVKPPNFQSDGAIVTANEGLSFQGASRSRVADKNSIMMVCIGATIGKVGVCSENVCFNQQINALTPSDKFDAELIYWQMRGRRFQSEVRAKAGQATLPIISKSKWQNLSIFVPGSLREQVEIRELLRDLNSQTEDYINLRQLKKRELSTLKSAILAQELQSEAA